MGHFHPLRHVLLSGFGLWLWSSNPWLGLIMPCDLGTLLHWAEPQCPTWRDENYPPTSPAAKGDDVILYIKDSAPSSPPKHFARMASGTRRSRREAPALPGLPVALHGPRGLPEH